MKSLKEYINIYEDNVENIDDQWLNDKKPVKTVSGYNVLIEKIDRSQVPNIIKGKININDKIYDWEWNDDGTCIKATDNYGNPKEINERDRLVKSK